MALREREGVQHFLAHAHQMEHQGKLSSRDMDCLRAHCRNHHLRAMDSAEYDRAHKAGMIDRLRELPDEEDGDEVLAHGNRVAKAVFAHAIMKAAERGAIDPEDAADFFRQMSDREPEPSVSPQQADRQIENYVGGKYGKNAHASHATGPQQEIDDYVAKRYGKRRR